MKTALRKLLINLIDSEKENYIKKVIDLFIKGWYDIKVASDSSKQIAL
ncbi:hypothetical protein AB3U99_02705 [Niallia sp. JL1B1071]